MVRPLGSFGGARMASPTIPHFANDAGAEKVHVGVKEFQCMGVRPPFDHPHVYLDMGADTQILCPYCATLFVYSPGLGPEETDPPGCRVVPQAAGT